MPWYKAGTATVTKGSPDVVGVGTTWGNGAITPGDSFSLVDSAGAAISPHYEVLSVTDDSHLTLTANYGGTSATGAQYALWNLAGEQTTPYLAAAVSELVRKCKNVEQNASTASSDAQRAETARSAAEIARDTAVAAKTAAETAKTDSLTAKTDAQTAANIAMTKAGEAATSATNAATSETNAATSEINAATSATNASNSAASASTSATTATAAANTATTKADEASVSATAANTSATNAAIYSNNASDKATSANNSALSASASAAQAALSTRIISRGVWVSSVSYSVGDFVSYNGAAYICITATSGTTTPDADTADWVSMSTTVIYRKAGIDI
jgi:hypothetical protein